MSEIKTGGPAFPVADPFAVKSPPTDAEALRLQQGMTLRDYFAAKAMAAMYASAFEWEPTGTPRTAEDRTVMEELAVDAYGIADAMLKAREQ